MKGTIKYPIEIDKVLWEKWKKTVPRDKTLNEALVELIENCLGERKEEWNINR